MKPGFVLDTSIAAAWCFEDEADPATDALLERLREDGAIVPALWRWEVANVLTTAVRRGRITNAAAQARFALLERLPIAVEDEAADRAWSQTFALAGVHNLTAYDAAYLELAARTGLPLATKDEDLRAAANTIGVSLFP